MADPQIPPFFTKGYQLTRFIPGNADSIQSFVPDHSPDPIYTYTYPGLDPETTYTFRCATVCGVETNLSVETNSEFISLTFSTGAIIPGDDRPPVLSVNYTNQVIPTDPPAPGFMAVYSWGSNVTITGTAVDESHLTLKLDGDAALQSLVFQGTGGVWEARLNLKKVGTNLITVQATDYFTNIAITNIIIVNLGRTNTAGISPNTVSEDYDGWISLQVDGVAVGQPILVEKYLDANANGIVDAGDLLSQSISITDGSAFNIGGIPFPTVPGDEDLVANGKIYGAVDFQSQSEINQLAAHYLIHITDSSGQFNSITLPMQVLPRDSPQKIIGQVTAKGLPVTGAVVLYSNPPNTNWIGGVVTDISGHFEVACPSGVYAIAAFKAGYVCNLNWTSQTMVNPGIDSIVNPTLLSADRLVQGTLRDSNTGLGGQQIIAQSTQGWAALTTTDSHGNFSLPVLAASYALLLNYKSVSMAGYLDLKNNPVANTLTGNVSGLVISLAKPDAAVFGAIKDARLQAVSGIPINAVAKSLPWSSTSIPTDSGGLYAIGISAGDWAAGPNPVDLIQQGFIPGDWPVVSPTNGEAIYYEFTAIRATAWLSGVVVDDNGTPLQGISIEAVDTSNFIISTTTDAAGAFRIGVSSGLWTLRINAADPRAPNFITPFLPLEVVDGIDQSDAMLRLYRINAQISGTVRDTLNQPITDTPVLASLVTTDTNAIYYAFGTTDAGGHYAINVSSGLWFLDLPNLDPMLYVLPDTRQILIDHSNVSEDYAIPFNGPLTLATTVLNEATPGLAFSQTLLAYGGMPPYAWTLAPASPPLPPPLQLSTDGILSGIPTALGSFPFTLLLTDSNGDSLLEPLMLIVKNPTTMRLQATEYQQSGSLLLKATGVAGVDCLIQCSDNFTNWATLLSTNSVADSFEFADCTLSNSVRRFYRLQKGN